MSESPVWNALRFRELLFSDVIQAVALLSAARADHSLNEAEALQLLLGSGKVPEVAEQLGREAVERDPSLLQVRVFQLVEELREELLRRKVVSPRIRELARQVAQGEQLSDGQRQELIDQSRKPR